MGYIDDMTRKSTDSESDKRSEVTKKLNTEVNKYFVPDFGTVEAETLEEAQEKVKKLMDKEEEGND